MNYYEIRDEIKTGDILLCNGNSFFSKGIKLLTDSIFSHVGLIVCINNRNMLFEAFDYGVRLIPLSLYINNFEYSGKPYDGKLYIYRNVKLSSTDKMVDYAFSKLGVPYGYSDILNIVKNIIVHSELKPDNNAKMICSEFVEECFNQENISINNNIERKYTYPSDFGKDIYFKLIAEDFI